MVRPLALTTLALALSACGGSPEPPEVATDSEGFVQHGAAIYEVAGCVTCHGAADGSVPPMDEMPDLTEVVARFGLTDETRDEAIEWIYDGALHDQSRDDARPFEGFAQFLVGARLYTSMIAGEDHSGFLRHAALEDPMPRWSDTLTQRDIEAVVAYLIASSGD